MRYWLCSTHSLLLKLLWLLFYFSLKRKRDAKYSASGNLKLFMMVFSYSLESGSKSNTRCLLLLECGNGL